MLPAPELGIIIALAWESLASLSAADGHYNCGKHAIKMRSTE